MKREIINTYCLGDMELIYEKDEEQCVGMLLIPLGTKGRLNFKKDYKTEPLVQVKILGDDYPFGFSQGRTMRNSMSTSQIIFQSQEKREINDYETQIITKMEDKRGYGYRHIVVADTRSKSLEVETTLTNCSNHDITVEMLSSFTIGGITPYDEQAEEGQLMLHRMLSTWSAEGKMERIPVEDLQLEPSWQKFSSNSIRYGQVGSMPVRGYVPFAAVEDKKHKVVWGVQLTHAYSWQIECYRRDESFVLSGGMADREFGQWFKLLKPGESLIAPKVVMTAVVGTVEELTGRLTGNMTRYQELPVSERNKMPMIFNEFCTSWGHPREEPLIHMAKLLKGRGLEYFVIDAGWYMEDVDAEAAKNWDAVGDWDISKSRYPSGFQKTIDIIKDCGMKPGLWFEFEIAGRGSRLFERSEWLLKRDGYDIVSGNRKFLDMRNVDVQKYLNEKVIGMLKTYGIEYIKVDYNENLGIGCDGAESQGEGLRQQILASQSFFRKIHKEMPELVIEICASGGHRLVPSFLEFASMASFSDAHECDEIPIIAGNMHRMILPRQSQVWAVLQKEHSLDKLYYRLTGTMLGRLCISGDIEGLNKEQWDIVQNGMDFYKRVSHIIDRGATFFQGTEIKSYRRPRGWQAVLRQGENRELLVVFHSFWDSPSQLTVEIPDGYWITDQYHKSSMNIQISEGLLYIEGIEDLDGAAILLEKEK